MEMNLYNNLERSSYQTVENRGNHDYLEENGPVKCKRINSWLGDGYYMWETFIDNAHWWGGQAGYDENGYMILGAKFDFISEKILDLVGNTQHMEFIKFVYNYSIEADEKYVDLTLRELLTYVKKHYSDFYNSIEAIRVSGNRVRRMDSKFTFEIPFQIKKNNKKNNNKAVSSYEFSAPIQICFFNKNSLNLRDFEIVYDDTFD